MRKIAIIAFYSFFMFSLSIRFYSCDIILLLFVVVIASCFLVRGVSSSFSVSPLKFHFSIHIFMLPSLQHTHSSLKHSNFLRINRKQFSFGLRFFIPFRIFFHEISVNERRIHTIIERWHEERERRKYRKSLSNVEKLTISNQWRYIGFSIDSFRSPIFGCVFIFSPLHFLINKRKSSYCWWCHYWWTCGDDLT